MKHIQEITNRYILPTIEEKTAYGYKRLDPYTKLFEDRIIFLGVQVDDASADDIMAQLLVLESQDPDRDITMYINSPGGSVSAGLSIFDTMQFIRPDVSTLCIGMAASMGAFLLAAGAKGKRFVLPNSTVMIHQPSGGFQGQVSDIERHAQFVIDLKRRFIDQMAGFTGRTPEQVERDHDRDNFLTAEQAKEYGIVDQVLQKRAKGG